MASLPTHTESWEETGEPRRNHRHMENRQKSQTPCILTLKSYLNIDTLRIHTIPNRISPSLIKWHHESILPNFHTKQITF